MNFRNIVNPCWTFNSEEISLLMRKEITVKVTCGLLKSLPFDKIIDGHLFVFQVAFT